MSEPKRNGLRPDPAPESVEGNLEPGRGTRGALQGTLCGARADPLLSTPRVNKTTQPSPLA